MKKYYILFCIVGLLLYTQVEAKTLALLINTTNDKQINMEFQEWSSDFKLKHFFDQTVVLCTEKDSLAPSKKNIVETIQSINKKKISQVFIFLYTTKTPNGNIITSDKQEIGNEILNLNTRSLCLIEYGKPFMTIECPATIDLWRAITQQIDPLIQFRGKLNKLSKSIKITNKTTDKTTDNSIDFNEAFQISLRPCGQSQDFTLNYNDFSYIYFSSRKKRKRGAVKFSSSDNFSTVHTDFIELPASEVFTKKIDSPYVYALSSKENCFKVFNKKNAQCVFTQPIGKDCPATFKSSVECIKPDLKVFAFMLQNFFKVGIFIKNEGDTPSFRFITIDGRKIPINAFDFGSSPEKNETCLIYLRNGKVRYHSIETNTKDIYFADDDPELVKTKDPKKVKQIEAKFKKIKQAKLLWHQKEHQKHTFILGKNAGFYWKAGTKSFKELYDNNDTHSGEYYIDTFYSGDNDPLGFICSAKQKEGNFQINLGILLNQNFKAYNLTDPIKKIMKDPKPSLHSLPIIFLKDKSLFFKNLVGLLIYNSNQNVTLKEIQIFPGDPSEVRALKDIEVSGIKEIDPDYLKIQPQKLFVIDEERTKKILWISRFLLRNKSKVYKTFQLYSFDF